MALQTVPGKPILWPQLSLTGLGTTSQLIDGDDDVVATVFQIPKTGTLTEVAFFTGTVTTGDDTFSVRLETVDGASGAPSGTLYVANASGTVDIADTDDNKNILCSINGGTGVSVTLGDVVAIRFERTDSSSANLRIVNHNTAYTGLPYLIDYNISGAAAWTKSSTGGGVCFALNIGGWISPDNIFPFQGTASEAIVSPKERGILINVPFKCKLSGVRAEISAGSGENYKFLLYSDPTGTPDAQLTGDDQDGDNRSSTGQRTVMYRFDSSFELSANTNYVLCVQATTANAIDVYYGATIVNTYNAALPGGATAVWYGRDTGDETSFAATDTRFPLFSAMLEQFDDGASAGGGAGPVMGGMVTSQMLGGF